MTHNTTLAALSLFFFIFLTGFKTPTKNQVSHYTLPYYNWMDAYATDNGEKRFFNIQKLMDELNLSRLQAVELQNQYRDLIYTLFIKKKCSVQTPIEDNDATYNNACIHNSQREDAFQTALISVKNNNFESKWKTTPESDGLIVVFDLDETLFYDKKGEKPIFSPGWKEAFKSIKKIGGKIVLFTAKPDNLLLPILEEWTITNHHNQKILVSNYVDAIFSNNHLIKQVANRSKNNKTVVIASKDLRILDESLNNVVIIDDNPQRIFQMENLRYIRKWKPTKGNDTLNQNHVPFYCHRLPHAIEEIIESFKWATEHKISFQQAFLPYSYAGRQLAEELAALQFNGNLKASIRHIREHPDIISTNQ
ncbi:MAG: NIF family HAD-type phosphatase [Gammaproteobacteria bacterium]|nr:NIF family HAD-type phosphatase [Gammaproteobacteria bacterium]